MKSVLHYLMQKKKLLLTVITFVVITILFLGLQMRSSASNIATFAAFRDEFVIDIKGKGDIEAVSKITLSVPDNVDRGIRIKKLVPDGSVVKKGDFLVQFDSADSENKVTEREEALENAISDLTAIKARVESNMKGLENKLKTQTYSYEQAQIRYEMMKYEADAKRREAELNLKKSELALKQAQKQIESQIIVDRADFAKEEMRVKQAELRYNEAVEELNSLTIRSPKDGFVVLQETYNRSTRTREKIKVGDSPHHRMPLVSIPDLSRMIVKTSVHEVDISKVETGQKAVFTLDALPGAVYYGVITGIATLAHRDEGTDNKVFDIEATIDNTDERIKPGMTAQCTIITELLPDQLIIPIDSVFEKDDKAVVYIKKSGFEQRVVKVGKRNSDYIIIKEGLEEGEEVALRDPTVLDERPDAQRSTTANGK